MIKAASFDFARPGLYVARGERVRLFDLAKMMRQRTTTTCPLRNDDIGAEPCQQPHRGFVDTRVEHGLCAAIEKRHAHFARALRSEYLRSVDIGGRRQSPWRHGKQPAQPSW